jgi:predicted ATPase
MLLVMSAFRVGSKNSLLRTDHSRQPMRSTAYLCDRKFFPRSSGSILWTKHFFSTEWWPLFFNSSSSSPLPSLTAVSQRHIQDHCLLRHRLVAAGSRPIHRLRSQSRFVSTLEVLREHVRAGRLHSDPGQERVAQRLTRLEQALVRYDNDLIFQQEKQTERTERSATDAHENNEHSLKPTSESSPMEQQNDGNSALTASKDANEDKNPPPISPSRSSIKIPRGLYIHGNVGTGKSMLMDSFYQNAPLQKKCRFHFHEFLSNVHTQIHQLKQQDLHDKGRNFAIDLRRETNPIFRVGKVIASELSLLCLDEFQVTDIADAVILTQLFSVLFHYGVVLVATSNRPPQDLYEGGLNRGYFLPFIDLLEQHCIVYHIPSERDYRRIVSNSSSFFVNNLKELEDLVLEIAMELSDEETCSVWSTELPAGLQRNIPVPRVYGGRSNNETEKSRPVMACFSFDELCDSDRGATDYRAVARAFDIVVVENIPILDVESHNRARRFITLIDELYEGKCALLCSAIHAETPMELFRKVKSQRAKDEYIPAVTENFKQEVIFWVDVAQEGGTPVGALASVRELAFAFDRASSRIIEMCSRSWWDRVLQRS